ncbi:MAG: thioesterase family protein [Brachymonas sp.]|nr:thioesterase family protein [Brachymonas sp.]
MSETFRTSHRVLFGQCDHAGIVFYPRYGDMSHMVLENWFREGVGIDLPTSIQRFGAVYPMVKLEMEYLRPSRYNEVLDFALQVLQLGGSSVTVRIVASCGEEVRVRMQLKMVNVNIQSLRPEPMPPEMRAGFARYLAADAQVAEI